MNTLHIPTIARSTLWLLGALAIAAPLGGCGGSPSGAPLDTSADAADAADGGDAREAGATMASDDSGTGGIDSMSIGTLDGAATDADGAAVAPMAPVIDVVVAATTTGGGLIIQWTLVGTCDSIDLERQDQIHGFPSSEHPVGAPQFPGLAGTSTSYADKTASDPTFSYTYHARCKLAGALSDWGNDVLAPGH
jgi:hypothetical protein